VLSLTTSPGARRGLEETQAAARSLGVRVLPVPMSGEAGALDATLAAVARERPGGIIVQPDPVSGRYNARIAELALKHGLPTMGGGKDFAVEGGLMGLGSDFREGWRLAAAYVDRILKGARPAELPVEQPTRFELVINLKTARALNLVMPAQLLLRATEVIE
jgi:putative ABC transport system substrate-binding protein